MDGSKTFENWLAGEFVFPETTIRYKRNHLSSKRPDIVQAKDIEPSELKKIRDRQRRIGYSLIRKRLKTAKREFSRLIKSTVDRKGLIDAEILYLENILLGRIPRRVSIYLSTCFDITLERAQWRAIANFYRVNIEKGRRKNFSFIASPEALDEYNKSAVETFAYFLYELLKWIKNLSLNQLKKFDELERQKNFVIARNFANGTIPALHNKGMTTHEIANYLGYESGHIYISQTIASHGERAKSIYKNKGLMNDTIEYCRFYGETVKADFIRRYKELEKIYSSRKA